MSEETTHPDPRIARLEEQVRALQSKNEWLQLQLEKRDGPALENVTVSAEEYASLVHFLQVAHSVGSYQLAQVLGSSELRAHFIAETLARRGFLEKESAPAKEDPGYVLTTFGKAWLQHRSGKGRLSDRSDLEGNVENSA